MTKQFTKEQINEKAKSLVEKNVVQTLQELIDFVNQHDPEMIPELISDAYNMIEITLEEKIKYLKQEHTEDYNAMLEEIFEGEDWYDDLKDSGGFASISFYVYLDAELHKDPDLYEHYVSSFFDEKKDNEDQPEILHFVMLSNDWIARKLREQGEITIELLGLDVWCRQYFGQAFHIDPCWESLALEMLREESQYSNDLEAVLFD